MDISEIVPNTREVEFLHPKTEEGTGLVFHMLPPTDPKVEEAGNKVANRYLGKRNFQMTAEMAEQERLARLVAAVEGWEWRTDANGEQATWGGAVLDFNESNLRRVLKNPAVRKQLLREMGDDAAFFEK